MTQFSPQEEDRFWSRVDRDGPIPASRPDLGPCWLWTGGLSGPKAYGRFCAQRKGWRAHRVAWFLTLGTWPVEDGLDHLCRVRLCVRPSHLEDVPAGVNTLRGESFAARNARATHCPQGHPYAGNNVGRLSTRNERFCRACRVEKMQAYRKRKKELTRPTTNQENP